MLLGSCSFWCVCRFFVVACRLTAYQVAPLWTNAFCYMVLGRMVWNYSPNGRIWKITASRFGVYFVVLDIVYCLHCTESEGRADRLQRLHRASLWCSICGRKRHTKLGGAQRCTTTAIVKGMTDMLRPPHIHDRSWDSAALYPDLLGICCTASSSNPTRPGS